MAREASIGLQKITKNISGTSNLWNKVSEVIHFFLFDEAFMAKYFVS